eukprot:GFKZ01003730.1.p1 GENE.GFKZ01003730.1~~GFKZ01003730.1.p1  ORF type:complete len:486 (+),score=46.89 GFKZ01003730.1:217-1674(+)
MGISDSSTVPMLTNSDKITRAPSVSETIERIRYPRTKKSTQQGDASRSRQSNFPQESLRDVLVLLMLLIKDKSRFLKNEKSQMDEERLVLTTVFCGVEFLLKRGVDYPTRTTKFAHFRQRLRDVKYRGSTGPQLQTGDLYVTSRKSIPSVGGGAVDIPTDDYTQHDLDLLMAVLSSPLVFRNYNRSIRIMHMFFAHVPTNCSPAYLENTKKWLAADLSNLGNDVEMPMHRGQKEVVSTILEAYQILSDSFREFQSVNFPKFESLEPIRFHPEGGKLRLKWTYVWLSRVYVVVVLIFSVVVAVLNFGSRDNLFERIFDAVQVSTLLLVSIFGLVKLTSEDPNVIRNSFLGYRVVRSSGDVMRVWDLRTEDELKQALAYTSEPQPWVEKEGTCYVVSGRGRGILLSYGIEPYLLYEVGGDIDGIRYFIGNDAKGYLIEVVSPELETAHIKENDYKHLFPKLSRTCPRISRLGGPKGKKPSSMVIRVV